MESSTAALSLSTIGQVAIIVKDLSRATAFYRDTLGIKFLFEVPGLSFFDAGGVRLMLGKAEKPEFDHPASILYYKVTDIAGAHRFLESRGVSVVHEPWLIAPMPDHDLWMSFYRDSEENHFALMSEAPRA
ncbi:MAG TPA: VOC family protein [Gemmatimonadaceae bacterium]|nr:VOC family protein [Gemmatimonadaceae bacterium]